MAARKVIPISVSPELYDVIDRMAARLGINRSAFIRLCVRQTLWHAEKEESISFSAEMLADETVPQK